MNFLAENPPYWLPGTALRHDSKWQEIDFTKFFSLNFSVIFTIGAIVMGVSVSKEVLLIGRLIVGAGIGLASMSVPMYISEASPPQFRGVLVSCNVLVITFGQFVGMFII